MIQHARARTSPALLGVFLAIFVTAGQAAGEHGDGHGSDDGHGTGMTNQDAHGEAGHGHDGGHSFPFGSAAPASQADRTIEVEANDRMEFSPATISVEKGETIRFVIKNAGQLQHSFTLATPAAQEAHEKEMKGMPMDQMASHMEGDPNGIVVQGGKTGSLTWRFTKAMDVEFACHIPGHYDAGMKGRIDIR